MPASSLEAEALPPLSGYWLALQWVHYTTSCNTQSSAPEDGQNNCVKHVELIGIINQLLLLHLVGCLYLFISMMHSQTNIKCLFQTAHKCSAHFTSDIVTTKRTDPKANG